MRFCPACERLLILKTDQHNKIKKYCPSCDKEYPITSPILKTINLRALSSKKSIITHAMLYDDVTYPRVKRQCENCPNDILKYAIMENMKNIYLCDKCRTVYE